MKRRGHVVLFIAVFWLMPGARSAGAQCQSSVPAQLNLYQSYCVHLCPDSALTFFLSCPYQGPEMFPHLVMSSGCSNGGPQGCNSDCTPVIPPAWPWAMGERPQFGQDPTRPDAIFVQNECMQMYVYWGHNGYWILEILANECSGCFCAWFDWQLPVELASFDAVAADSRVTLNWKTASESSNDHFEIVREDRGIVASLRSEGNGPAGHNYTWIDTEVENARTYTYHLRAVDYNSQVDDLRTLHATPAFSPETVRDFALYQNYPNPFNPTTRIVFEVPIASRVKLAVFNPVGKQIACLVDGVVSAGRYAVNFEGASLPSGLYFFTMHAGGGYTATRKMLLVK